MINCGVQLWIRRQWTIDDIRELRKEWHAGPRGLEYWNMVANWISDTPSEIAEKEITEEEWKELRGWGFL